MGSSLLLFFGVLLTIRLAVAEKAVLAIVYLLTMWAVLYGSSTKFFWNNFVVFNLLIGLAPVLMTVATWLLLKRRKRSIKK